MPLGKSIRKLIALNIYREPLSSFTPFKVILETLNTRTFSGDSRKTTTKTKQNKKKTKIFNMKLVKRTNKVSPILLNNNKQSIFPKPFWGASKRIKSARQCDYWGWRDRGKVRSEVEKESVTIWFACDFLYWSWLALHVSFTYSWSGLMSETKDKKNRQMCVCVWAGEFFAHVSVYISINIYMELKTNLLFKNVTYWCFSVFLVSGAHVHTHAIYICVCVCVYIYIYI